MSERSTGADTPARTDRQPRQVVVRGFVVPRSDGQWYAHCIDLTVDALAPTRAEAIERLNLAAAAYLDWASEHGASLRRPSPLGFRLRYQVYALRDKVRSLFGGPPAQANSGRTFHRPLPA